MNSVAIGTTLPANVEAAYTKYLLDHHGDLSDTENLALVFYNAGARQAIQNMVEFGDVIPQMHRIEGRFIRLLALLDGLQS